MKKLLFLILLGLSAAAFSLTTLDDPYSTRFRQRTETTLNTYIESLLKKAKADALNPFDQAMLHVGILSGIAISYPQYPEAAHLLFHYVYGDSSELELDSSYFETSAYLQSQIKALGPGEHGPLALHQSEDWRLSLTLNPYYLNITESSVRLFHPWVEFAAIDAEPVMTIVPIGKLRIKIYDNLVSAAGENPFYAFAEWRSLIAKTSPQPQNMFQ